MKARSFNSLSQPSTWFECTPHRPEVIRDSKGWLVRVDWHERSTSAVWKVAGSFTDQHISLYFPPPFHAFGIIFDKTLVFFLLLFNRGQCFSFCCYRLSFIKGVFRLNFVMSRKNSRDLKACVLVSAVKKKKNQIKKYLFVHIKTWLHGKFQTAWNFRLWWISSRAQTSLTPLSMNLYLGRS